MTIPGYVKSYIILIFCSAALCRICYVFGYQKGVEIMKKIYCKMPDETMEKFRNMIFESNDEHEKQDTEE